MEENEPEIRQRLQGRHLAHAIGCDGEDRSRSSQTYRQRREQQHLGRHHLPVRDHHRQRGKGGDEADVTTLLMRADRQLALSESGPATIRS